MVIVESIALATMISNHVDDPVVAAQPGCGTAGLQAEDDLRQVVLMARRLAIAGGAGVGIRLLTSFRGGSAALASIGLIAFLPALHRCCPRLLGGIFWRGCDADRGDPGSAAHRAARSGPMDLVPAVLRPPAR